MQRLLHKIPKPILFGLLGAAGCFIGWAVGEPLFIVLKQTAAGEGHAGGAPTILSELDKRLAREGAKSGAIQISLMWDNFNDLDLHCVEPSDERIFYSHKKSASHGELDVDMNAGSGPYSSQPVENIFWPSGDEPAGTYVVMVHHYALHSDVNATAYLVRVKIRDQVQEFRGTVAHPQTNLVHTFSIQKGEEGLRAQNRISWKPSLIIGFWTASLAVFTSLLLVMGQNRLMRRNVLNQREALVVVGGGLVAGLISGAISQQLFSVTAATLANHLSNQMWVMKGGQVVGWALLGGLLGFGLSFFIPNLPRLRAGIAGVVGGGVGSIVFLIALQTVGEIGGRLMGALILGFVIGLCIAFAETTAREAALVVHWSANEETLINLGNRSIVLGSSSEAHIYLPRDRGFPPVAATITLRNGKVEMENKITNKTHHLQGGNILQIGPLAIEVRTFT